MSTEKEVKKIIHKEISIRRFADFMLDVGTFLLSSGAHCGRIYSNLNRIANTWGFEIDINPTFKGLLITVKEVGNEENSLTLFKTAPAHIVHLSVLTDISHLSWNILEEKLTIDEAEKRFAAIKAKPNYKDWVIAIAVGFSCAGLCLLAEGSLLNALTALIAAFIGSLVRAWITAREFNAMIAVSIAAFTTTLITGLGSIYEVGANPQAAMATGVLYLIPGVPLINCVIDLIEGYLTSAINRGLFAGFTLLCIAAGMTLCITLLGIGYF